MADERILKTLRLQAWERAKGEMQAMLQTYHPKFDNDGNTVGEYAKVEELVSEVINAIDGRIY